MENQDYSKHEDLNNSSFFESSDNYSNSPTSIFQKILRGLKDILLIYLAIGGIFYLVLALIIPPLNNLIKKGMRWLCSYITDKYDDLTLLMTYKGNSIILKTLSLLGLGIINFYCYILFINSCMYMAILQIYGVIVFPLCKPLANTASYLFNASGKMLNRITNWLAFSENTKIGCKIPSILSQIFMHYINLMCMFMFGELAIVAYILLFWHPRLKGYIKNAIKRSFKRSWRNLVAIAILCTGRQPEPIEIEDDGDDVDNILHFRKDGKLDMRYVSSKEYMANH